MFASKDHDRINKLEEDFRSFKNTQDLILDNLKEIKNEIKQSRIDNENQINEVKTEIAEIKTDIAEVKTDIAGVKTDIAGVKTDITEVRTEITEVKTEIKNLETEVKNEIKEIKTQIGFLAESIKEVKAQFSGLFNTVTGLCITALLGGAITIIIRGLI